MEEARITIRVSRDLYEQAKEKARREDITLSQVLRRALKEWLKDPPKQGGESE
jgi:predicted DNA binding CopG/RHH family protein